MQKIKLISVSIGFFLSLAGCSVKETDAPAMKVAKHTANSPMYVLVGTGMLIETALIGAIVAPIAIVDYGKEKIIENEESK